MQVSHKNYSVIDFMLLTENGSNEYEILKRNEIPPAFSSLMDKIKQKMLIVTHSGLVAMLIATGKDKRNYAQWKALFEIKNNWEVKINTEGDWAILNPKLAGKSLSEIGFVKNLSDLWSQAALVSDLESRKFKPVNKDNFKNLFDENPRIRRRIFLNA